MGFDQIPRYSGGTPITDLSMRGWLARNRHWLLMLTIGVVLLDVLMTVYSVAPLILSGPPGGLDGCILSASGQPVLAKVRVGDAARETYTDGCFFFSELPPGSNQVAVETTYGVVLIKDVEIISGEAVALGTINLP